MPSKDDCEGGGDVEPGLSSGDGLWSEVLPNRAIFKLEESSFKRIESESDRR